MMRNGDISIYTFVNLLETSENSEEKVPVQAATHNNGGR